MGVVKIRCSIISTIWCKYKCKAFQIQQEVILTIFFFFFINKNDIYTKVYSMHEEHRANPEVQEEENKEKSQ